jgi:hypothetical protein
MSLLTRREVTNVGNGVLRGPHFLISPSDVSNGQEADPLSVARDFIHELSISDKCSHPEVNHALQKNISKLIDEQEFQTAAVLTRLALAKNYVVRSEQIETVLIKTEIGLKSPREKDMWKKVSRDDDLAGQILLLALQNKYNISHPTITTSIFRIAKTGDSLLAKDIFLEALKMQYSFSADMFECLAINLQKVDLDSSSDVLILGIESSESKLKPSAINIVLVVLYKSGRYEKYADVVLAGKKKRYSFEKRDITKLLLPLIKNSSFDKAKEALEIVRLENDRNDERLIRDMLTSLRSSHYTGELFSTIGVKTEEAGIDITNILRRLN